MNPFIQQHKQVSVFVTAGFPKLESLPDQLLFLQAQGVDFIEIGIPFSDPMADGPVIQHTSSIALENGMQLDLLFRQLASVRDQLTIPIVLMGYLNPVLQYNLGNFLGKCQELKIASVILPDLSVELFETKYATIFSSFNVPVTFLITPKTPDERVKRIANVCSNSFVYLVGQNSITGNSYTIDSHMQERYAELKSVCGTTPLFLGFGIDSKAKKEQAFEHCDGAIVGSAYLKALEHEQESAFLEALG